MFNTETGRPSLVIATLKTVAAVAALSFLAANWLSSSLLDNRPLARLAAQDDPVTTGGIGRKAAQTKLDPCVLPKAR